MNRTISISVFALLFAVRAFTQSVPPAQPKTDDLVLVRVTVSGEFYKPLNVKLNKENFRIFEDKRPQEIQSFSNDDVPLSLGILLDVSGSMGDHHKLEAARRGIIEFLRASNPQDEAFMVAFAEKPEVVFEMTPLKDIREIPRLEAKKRTALLDAIYLGLEKIRTAHNSHKVLLIFSDGGDNASQYTEDQVKARLRETDAQIYSLCIFGSSTFRPPEEARGPDLLSKITGITGGATLVVANFNDLVDAAAKVGTELRTQYVLGYRSTNTARDGRWRKIEVKVVPPKGTKAKHVTAREGYYAPSGPAKRP